MIDNVSQRLGKLYNIDITRNVTAMARLSREVGKAKIALSTHQETVIRLDGLLPSVNVRQFFTRAQFEEITESLVNPPTSAGICIFALAHSSPA